MKLDRKHLTLAAGLLLTAIWEPVPHAYALGGLPLWTNFYSGPGNYTDYAKAIGVDRDGNVFVAGYSANSKRAALDFMVHVRPRRTGTSRVGSPRPCPIL